MKFIRHAAHRKKRLSKHNNWRRPRGLHNKMRLEKKGSKPRVKEGYRTKAIDRNKKNGLEIVRVHNVSDVQAVDAKTQGIVVANIGMKKKIQVLEEIKKNKLTLLTGDVDNALSELKQRFETRISKKKEIEKEKLEKQKELEKKAEKVEKETEKKSASTPLSKVKGVGPATIKKLEEAGIQSAEELAEMSEEQLSEKVEGVSAKKIIDAATKTTEGQDEKEKVLTKAR